MKTLSKGQPGTETLDRQALIRLAEEIDAQAGIAPDPQMSIAKLRELMQSDGVRPEDNGASRELIRMRYGDDWDKD